MLSSSFAAAATLFAAAITNAIPVEPATIEDRATPACAPGRQALLLPKAGSTIDQYNDGNYDCTMFEVLYCSGQYFKTRSINVDLLLSFPGQTSGQLLEIGQTPTSGTAPAGYYGYRFNATICPEDGDYITGQRTLTIYETASGTMFSYR